jgi:protein SCO1/2
MKRHLIPFIALAMSLHAAEPEKKKSCCEEKAAPGVEGHKLEAAAAAKGSILDFEHEWTDQSAKPFRLSSLRGKPIVLAMGYASCQFACPRIMADLMAIERGLSDAEKTSTHFVFITIDPEKDTPAALAAFLETYKVDSLRWHAVRGSADDIREISVALGVKFKAIEGGDFAHSNLITLLGSDGTIIHRQQGLGEKPEDLIKALRDSLKP